MKLMAQAMSVGVQPHLQISGKGAEAGDGKDRQIDEEHPER